ncbi:hypothetical protein pipiens_015328 [Culex pipiens pipiens]|uniref:Uncharacterized protein n=1 Tax=Culex pipiens pipiens TaxID=38569 RepID=A0ABD1CQX7_CULPP
MDFSEAETISSGFSDKISSKTTQMDERPRNFLCTMANVATVGRSESVCGRERGKAGTPKVPPVTPAGEEPPSEFGDDTRSVISSAVFEQSFAMSECINESKRKEVEKQNKYVGGEQTENKPPVGVAALPCSVRGTRTPPSRPHR